MRFRQLGALMTISVGLLIESRFQPVAALPQRPIITTSNISRLTQVADAGKGQIVTVIWSPNSRWVAVATTGGVWLYDSSRPNIAPKHFGTNYAQTVAFNEDSTLISAAGWSNSIGGILIQSWDIDTQKELLHIENRYPNYPTMTFSPSGDLFGVFRSDGSVQLWQIPSGESIATFKLGPFWNVTGIAISPDNAYFAVSADNGDYGAERLIVRSTGLKRTLSSQLIRTGFFLFSPNNTSLAASLGDIKLFNPVVGSLVATIESSAISRNKNWDDGSFGRNFSYSANGNLIAVITGKADDAIRLWNVSTKITNQLLTGHTKAVSAVELSADGNQVFSSSFDGTIRIWDTASGKQKTLIRGDGLGYYAVFVSPDAKKLAAPDVNGELWLWDSASGVQLARWDGFIERITAVAFSPYGQNIAIASSSNIVNSGNPWAFGLKPYTLRVWDWQANTLRVATEGTSAKFTPYFDFGVNALAYSSDGTRLFAVTYSATLQYETDRFQQNISFENKLSEHIDAVTQDGLYFIAMGYEATDWRNGILNVYSTRTLERVASFRLPNRQLDTVVSSSDGSILAVNTYISGTERFASDGLRTLILFDLDAKRVIQQIEAPYRSMKAVTISHDNQVIASSGQQTAIELWDIALGSHLATISSPALSVDSLLFNADDGLLFVATNQSVDIYDVQKRERIHQLDVLTPFLALSRDGTLLATGAEDGTVKVWATVGMEIK
jgi:WD40 repeat protein